MRFIISLSPEEPNDKEPDDEHQVDVRHAFLLGVLVTLAASPDSFERLSTALTAISMIR
ncbi:hypothetical protein ACWCPT_09245 [Streptomyces sp. NPDC002308]